MKINESELGNIPHKKEFLSLLKSLSNLKEGASIHPYLERILLLVKQDMAIKTVPTLFPQLAKLANESNDFGFVNFLVNMKVGVYQRLPLDDLSDEDLRLYLLGIQTLRNQVFIEPNKEVGNWSSEFTSMYLWNAMLLYTHSPDALVFLENTKYETPFKVTCTHCGNDVHSLVINEEDMSLTSKITPAPVPPRKEGVLFHDDVYETFFPVFLRFGEQKFGKILPYVYGTYECTTCNQKNVVMEAVKARQFKEEAPYSPTVALLERLHHMAMVEDERLFLERWGIARFSVSMHRGLYGKTDLKAYILPLKLCHHYFQEVDPAITKVLCQEVKELLKLKGHAPETRGEVLRYFTVLMELERDCAPVSPDNKGEILAFYEEAQLLAGKIWGRDHENTKAIALNFVSFRAKVEPEQETEILEAFYDGLDTEKDIEIAHKLEDYLYGVYVERGDYVRALYYKSCLKQHLSREFGEFTEETADFEGEWADVYLRAGQPAEARECYKRGIHIYLTQLGSAYQLPPLFPDYQNSTKKVNKKAKTNEQIFGRALTVSSYFSELGCVTYQMGFFEEALREFEKAMVLWDWMAEARSLKCGTQRLDIAFTLEQLGDTKTAIIYCEKALGIYEICKKNETLPERLEMVEQGLKEGYNLLRRLKHHSK